MKLISPELQQRFDEIGSQATTKDPIIVAMFFNPVGTATWYATEYNPKTRVCYGYVTGLTIDEWGSFLIPELESIELPFCAHIKRDISLRKNAFPNNSRKHTECEHWK